MRCRCDSRWVLNSINKYRQLRESRFHWTKLYLILVLNGYLASGIIYNCPSCCHSKSGCISKVAICKCQPAQCIFEYHWPNWISTIAISRTSLLSWPALGYYRQNKFILQIKHCNSLWPSHYNYPNQWRKLVTNFRSSQLNITIVASVEGILVASNHLVLA